MPVSGSSAAGCAVARLFVTIRTLSAGRVSREASISRLSVGVCARHRRSRWRRPSLPRGEGRSVGAEPLCGAGARGVRPAQRGHRGPLPRPARDSADERPRSRPEELRPLSANRYIPGVGGTGTDTFEQPARTGFGARRSDARGRAAPDLCSPTAPATASTSSEASRASCCWRPEPRRCTFTICCRPPAEEEPVVVYLFEGDGRLSYLAPRSERPAGVSWVANTARSFLAAEHRELQASLPRLVATGDAQLRAAAARRGSRRGRGGRGARASRARRGL